MPQPRLVTTSAPRAPEAVALALHGGASRPGAVAVSPTQLSVLRMVPVARRITRAGRGRLAVHRLLNSHGGWNAAHTPVDDVVWALGELRGRYGDLPVALVGHSLGGRAALLAGSQPAVRTVVALNPWVYPTDRPDLSGRRVLIAHGTADGVADLGRAEAVAAAIGRTTDVELVRVEGGDHAMLRRGGQFERLAAEFCVSVLSRPGR